MGERITNIAGLNKIAKEWCGFRRTRNLDIGEANLTVSSEGLGGAPAISMTGEKYNFSNFTYNGIIEHLQKGEGKKKAKKILEVYQGKRELAELDKPSILLVTIVEISEMIRGSAASKEFQRVVGRIAEEIITWTQGFCFPSPEFVWAQSASLGKDKTIQLDGAQNPEYVIKGESEIPVTEEDKEEALKRIKAQEQKQKTLDKELEQKISFINSGKLRRTKGRENILEKYNKLEKLKERKLLFMEEKRKKEREEIFMKKRGLF